MKIDPAEFSQNIDDELSKADRLVSEGKPLEALVELVGALLIEVRGFREEWRRSDDA